MVAEARSRLLVADEDPIARAFLTDNLIADGYDVIDTDDGDVAVHKLVKRFDALVVDVNGATLGVIDAIRGEARDGVDPLLPILALTSHGADHHVTRLLERGADDVLVKPYSYPELRARVAALLRRATARREPRVLSAGSLRLDVATRRAWVGEHEVEALPDKEYRLLLALIGEPSRVFTREELMRAVWGSQTFGRSRTLDSHCARLRARLRVGEERFVLCRWGVGYRLLDG